MVANIPSREAQLHPYQVALKKSWAKLKVIHDIKQDWLAQVCGVNKSTVSRWLNADEADYPDRAQFAKFIEALQQWPGVEKWEPLEALNAYFGCHVTERHHPDRSIQTLVGLLALDTGKASQSYISDGDPSLIAPIVRHLRRIADDLDDELNCFSPKAKGA